MCHSLSVWLSVPCLCHLLKSTNSLNSTCCANVLFNWQHPTAALANSQQHACCVSLPLSPRPLTNTDIRLKCLYCSVKSNWQLANLLNPTESRMIYLGLVWPWPLTTWPPKSTSFMPLSCEPVVPTGIKIGLFIFKFIVSTRLVT